MIAPLPPGPFAAAYADPAWQFKTRSAKGEGKSPQSHYRCMTLDAIKALPVADVMAKDSALFLWATFPMLHEALDVMRHWGFTYKTGGAWAKQSSTGRKWQFGTGFIFRSASELLLVGTRGKPRWLSKSERNLWVAPIREHSRKPDALPPMIDRMIAGPKLEMFARRNDRPGWAYWGNDQERFNDAGTTATEPRRSGGDGCAIAAE